MTDDNEAGASARREYERRRARDEARVREEWGQGRLGNLAVKLTPERQSTRAWSVGAEGERVVGARLDAMASDAVRVLHDRRIPGTRANIDHLVVTAGAVWVIDAKKYSGRPELRVEGGIIRPRVEKLVVGGRDKTSLVDGIAWQVEKVHDVVREAPIRAALCFVEADWPLIGGSFATRDVDVVWPKKLVTRITESSQGSLDVSAIAQVLASRFPAAAR